jgi:hypothetical protein
MARKTCKNTTRYIVKGSDDGVQYLELPFFLLCSSSGILKTREHNVPESRSVSVLR